MKKEEKTEYPIQVQRRKTIKYGDKQHYQDYVTIPAQLSETLKLQPKQWMKCVLNGNGNSLIYTIMTEPPGQNRETDNNRYEDWLQLVRKFTPTGTWKACEQILKQAGARIPPPPIWVRLAENDIGLLRKLDSKTHRIVWSLDHQKTAPARMKDVKLTDLV